MRRTSRRLRKPNQVLLSILMLHLPSRQRIEKYSLVAPEILRQASVHPVEFLIIGDNKTMSVGEKRNVAIDIATGKYVCFVDDDDEVSEDYVSSLVEGCRTNSDAVVFDMDYYKDEKYYAKIRFDLVNRNHRNGTGFNWMVNHLCPIKRELAVKVNFGDMNLREDFDFAERIRPHIRTIHRIEKTLYTYRFNTQTTETRRQR